jgi:hypothetical protein
MLMFSDRYGDDIVVEEMPTPDDRIWSQETDRRILELLEGSNPLRYGRRFCAALFGRYRRSA